MASELKKSSRLTRALLETAAALRLLNVIRRIGIEAIL